MSTSTIDGYQLLGTVATTATATVWKARDLGLKRDVALKQVRSGTDAAVRVRSEAVLLATVRHPNIVDVYDLLDHDEHVWLVEQWIDGAPLDRVLSRVPALCAVDALALTHGALLGLAHTHARGIVHGDVHPTNILIDALGTPMLVDFGLAAVTGTSGVGGTPGYGAPEAFTGEPVTPRSDVYSSAATLARLLLGHPLYRADTAAGVIAAQCTQPPMLTGIEPAIAAVLHRALAIDPESRPPNAEALLTLLDTAAETTYGAGWLVGSSLGAVGGGAATIIGGLQLGGAATVGGTAAAGGTAASGSTAATGSTAAASGGGTIGGGRAVSDLGATEIAPIVGRLGAKKLFIATGVTAAVIAAAAIGYALLAADTQPSADIVAQNQSAPGLESGTAAPQHPSAALSGNFEVVATVVSTDNKYNSGPGRSLRWTLKAAPVCPGPGLPCSVALTTDNGTPAARFNAGEWSATYGYNGHCVDWGTGIRTGGSAAVTRTIVLHTTPTGVAGTIDEVATGDCPGSERSEIVGTPIPG